MSEATRAELDAVIAIAEEGVSDIADIIHHYDNEGASDVVDGDRLFIQSVVQLIDHAKESA